MFIKLLLLKSTKKRKQKTISLLNCNKIYFIIFNKEVIRKLEYKNIVSTIAISDRKVKL